MWKAMDLLICMVFNEIKVLQTHCLKCPKYNIWWGELPTAHWYHNDPKKASHEIWELESMIWPLGMSLASERIPYSRGSSRCYMGVQLSWYIFDTKDARYKAGFSKSHLFLKAIRMLGKIRILGNWQLIYSRQGELECVGK